MSNRTRRALLRESVIAAAAAVLLSDGLPHAGAEQEHSGDVFHVFAFRWKPGTTEAQKERAAKEIRAFQGVIPGLLETHAGPNISPRGAGYTFGGIMRFASKAALDAYVQHPAHQALLVWLVPLIDPVELDLYA